MPRAKKLLPCFALTLVVAGVAFFCSEATFGGEVLNRSIYVPVQINLDKEFSHAVLYKGEEALRSLPGKQVFQFTYYPSLHRLVPEMQELHIKAYRRDGTHIDVGLVVTSSAVYIGDRCVHLDMRRMLKHMRRGVDFRYEPVKLKLCCDKSASDTDKAVVGEASND